MSRSTCSRRAFLQRSGTALLGTGLAISSGILGCTAMTTLEAVPHDGRLTVETAEFRELAKVGGAVQVNPARPVDPILLVRVGADQYRAISSTCTHLGCQVRKTRYALRCPCHGSMYDFEGQVLNGPAQHPLTVYPVEVSGTIVTIHLG